MTGLTLAAVAPTAPIGAQRSLGACVRYTLLHDLRSPAHILAPGVLVAVSCMACRNGVLSRGRRRLRWTARAAVQLCAESPMRLSPMTPEVAEKALAALGAAEKLALCTENLALALHLRESFQRLASLAKIASTDLLADLAVYEAFFQATETSGAQAHQQPSEEAEVWGSGSSFLAQEAWLEPLLGQNNNSRHNNNNNNSKEPGNREAVMASAAKEGVRLFRISSDGGEEEAAEAALHFHQHGFAVLQDVLSGDKLAALQQLSAQLVRIAVCTEPSGNRGKRRYTLGRTTVVGAGLSLADSPAVCSMLQEVWKSEDFSVQCTGGDFSLPGAEAQDLHADVPGREIADQLYASSQPGISFLDLPTPVVKVYFAMVDLDEQTGPPRFVRGSHLRTAREDVPPRELGEPPSVRAFCTAGSAIVMDQRVWHGGTCNVSQLARPMLSVHYAGPRYSEDVLKDGGTIPFFGTPYWCYHRGAVPTERLESLSSRGQELCRHLTREAARATPGRCSSCACLVSCGRDALPSIGRPAGPWLCLACWAKQRDSFGQ
ncbi:unnamed protein product [Polarella glacialis]|uniref:Uncharacterized protein n=1 Tax=Polarella glacialis TaxID=89957 RepID=A0A813LLC6_POLGL|nr:unnamed protein product [Polarella glacialis]